MVKNNIIIFFLTSVKPYFSEKINIQQRGTDPTLPFRYLRATRNAIFTYVLISYP